MSNTREEIKNNYKFGDILSKLIKYWKQIKHSKLFYEDTGLSMKNFQDNIARLESEYPIFTTDLFELIVLAISKDKDIDPIQFLLDIKKEDICDSNNLFIVKYIVAKFEPNEIKKYHLYQTLPRDIDKWFEYISFLSDYNLFHIFKSQHETLSELQFTFTFQKYVEAHRKVNVLEKDNQEMKKRIEELELQLK